MGIIAWSEKSIQKFKFWDIAIFKIYLFGLGIIVGAYISGFVIMYVWYFAVIVVLSGAWLLYKMFSE